LAAVGLAVLAVLAGRVEPVAEAVMVQPPQQQVLKVAMVVMAAVAALVVLEAWAERAAAAVMCSQP
jgi:hypothetical protein